jgi:hypothetical protein
MTLPENQGLNSRYFNLGAKKSTLSKHQVSSDVQELALVEHIQPTEVQS